MYSSHFVVRGYGSVRSTFCEPAEVTLLEIEHPIWIGIVKLLSGGRFPFPSLGHLLRLRQ
jgi:hypothetical protein